MTTTMMTKTIPARAGRSLTTAALAATLAALLAGTALPSARAAGGPGGHGIVTMTRGIKVFSDLEGGLMDGLQQKDASAMDRLVAADFEQRNGEEPGSPLPRAEWLEKAQAEAANGDAIRQMAVHDHGDLCVVSFLLQRKNRPDAFVVDVWKKTGEAGAYQLATRYFSAAAAPFAPPPARVTKGAVKKPAASAPVVDTKK